MQPHQDGKEVSQSMSIKEKIMTRITNKLSFEQAKAAYVHRFTTEHVPAWARVPPPDKSLGFYAPQYRTDREWYDNTEFPTRNTRRFCSSSNQSWPLGRWLDKPFAGERVNQGEHHAAEER